jgi:hypothetical protein
MSGLLKWLGRLARLSETYFDPQVFDAFRLVLAFR